MDLDDLEGFLPIPPHQTVIAPDPVRHPGSFRDPSGFVVVWGDRIFRAISRSTFSDLQNLNSSGLLSRLEEQGLLVKTYLAVGASELKKLEACFPEAEVFIEHQCVPITSFPYEWSFSMLCDAALLQLKLQQELIQAGYTLKDASAYNVQFLGSRPIFIDLPSIEKTDRLAVWQAYSQFCQMFLFPLLLSHYGKMSQKAYFIVHLNGLGVEDTAAQMGWFNLLRPANFIDLFLQNILQKQFSNASTSLNASAPTESHDPSAQAFNLRRLERRIRRIREARTFSPSQWLRYDALGDDEYVRQKERFVAETLASEKPERVIDLGANRGRYSLLAARTARWVVAVDADESCVDFLYKNGGALRDRILPLCMDLANPSPGIGLDNIERAAFLDRVKADGALALALVHHLLVTTGASIERVAAYLSHFSSRFLVIEYIDPKDPQFLSIVGQRPHLWTDLTRERFIAAFERHGRLVRSADLSSYRAIYQFGFEG